MTFPPPACALPLATPGVRPKGRQVFPRDGSPLGWTVVPPSQVRPAASHTEIRGGSRSSLLSASVRPGCSLFSPGGELCLWAWKLGGDTWASSFLACMSAQHQEPGSSGADTPCGGNRTPWAGAGAASRTCPQS